MGLINNIYRAAQSSDEGLGGGAKERRVFMKTRIRETIVTDEEIDRMIMRLIHECQEIQGTCTTDAIRDVATNVIESLSELDKYMDYE